MGYPSFRYFATYVIIFGMVVTIVSQIHWLQKGWSRLTPCSSSRYFNAHLLPLRVLGEEYIFKSSGDLPFGRQHFSRLASYVSCLGWGSCRSVTSLVDNRPPLAPEILKIAAKISAVQLRHGSRSRGRVNL